MKTKKQSFLKKPGIELSLSKGKKGHEKTKTLGATNGQVFFAAGVVMLASVARRLR